VQGSARRPMVRREFRRASEREVDRIVAVLIDLLRREPPSRERQTESRSAPVVEHHTKGRGVDHR